MLCPKCRGEFVEGIRICPDCEVDMVDGVVEETSRSPKVVTVLETRNPFELDVAESLLSQEQIQFWKQGEGLVDMFAPVRLGSGYDLLTGPVALQVEATEAERARALLEQARETK